MRVGFIGAGNMASALMRGALASKQFAPLDIEAYDIDSDKLKALEAELAIGVTASVFRLISDCDLIVLAVKPVALPGLFKEIGGALSIKKPPILSIAAGQSIERLTQLCGCELPLIRVMPNLNASVGAGVCAYCANSLVTDEIKTLAVTLLRCSGEAYELEERLFPAFDALGGAAPAFCFMFADALARAGVRSGLKRELAYAVALQVMAGSVKLMKEDAAHPWELVDKVCSPGGITIEGVLSLQGDCFEQSVAQAIDAVIKKDLTL